MHICVLEPAPEQDINLEKDIAYQNVYDNQEQEYVFLHRDPMQ